jgi:hypothetical protein
MVHKRREVMERMEQANYVEREEEEEERFRGLLRVRVKMVV